MVTSMWPTPQRPALGSFVRDQVEALHRREGVDLELYTFAGGASGVAKAALELRRRHHHEHFDLIHVHFGLTAWPALLSGIGAPVVVTLHGNDLFHPRSNRITRAALP